MIPGLRRTGRKSAGLANSAKYARTGDCWSAALRGSAAFPAEAEEVVRKKEALGKIHKRLLDYIKVNRPSLDHLLLGMDADIDEMSHAPIIARVKKSSERCFRIVLPRSVADPFTPGNCACCSQAKAPNWSSAFPGKLTGEMPSTKLSTSRCYPELGV